MDSRCNPRHYAYEHHVFLFNYFTSVAFWDWERGQNEREVTIRAIIWPNVINKGLESFRMQISFEEYIRWKRRRLIKAKWLLLRKKDTKWGVRSVCVCVSGRTQIGVSKSKCHLSLCDSFFCVSTSYWLSAFQRHHSKFICKHESHRSFYSSHCCLQLKPHLLAARWLFLFHRVSVHRQPNVYHGVAWLCLSSAVRNVKLAYKINLLLTKLSLIYNKVDYVT